MTHNFETHPRKWLRELELNQRPTGYEGLKLATEHILSYFTLFYETLKNA